MKEERKETKGITRIYYARVGATPQGAEALFFKHNILAFSAKTLSLCGYMYYSLYFPPGGQYFFKYSVYKVERCSDVPSPSEIPWVRLG